MYRNRPLSSFPFCREHKNKLKQSGLNTVSDLVTCTADHLSSQLQVAQSEAIEILRQIREYIDQNKEDEAKLMIRSQEKVKLKSFGGTSALDLLKKEDKAKRIITFSQKIDEMLEGGVKVGSTTEICGSPGIGKTQLCMQLSVDATIPSCFGGADGEAVYIDTEGSFVSERIAQMARSTVTHIQTLAAATTDQTTKQASLLFTQDYILNRIHYYRCHTHLQLIALTNILDSFLSEHPSVVLVVIDSIASPFRHGFRNLSLRTRLLSGLSQTLIKMAIQFELAVVLTNQMTTRSGDGNRTCLVPALGESWGHASTIRIMLYWEDNERHAFLFKSPSHRESTVPFQSDGIRDVTPPSTVSRTPSEVDSQFPIIQTQTVHKSTSESNYENEDELDYLFENASACLADIEGDIDDSPLKKRQHIAEAPDV